MCISLFLLKVLIASRAETILDHTIITVPGLQKSVSQYLLSKTESKGH